MLFLLNDTILNLDAAELSPPVSVGQFEHLSLAAISQLGQELFAADPLLPKRPGARAKRLAALIVAREPRINAALFVALAKNCRPEQVAVRYAQIGIEVMAELHQRQKTNRLSPVEADRQVWQRFAA